MSGSLRVNKNLLVILESGFQCPGPETHLGPGLGPGPGPDLNPGP